MIRAEHLDKWFSNVHAVDDLTLEARNGEISGLIGPNGAGKSTTIRMITNIIHPDSGSISYDDAPFSETVRRKIGYLAEERGLYQKARILETIVHFARLRGLDEKSGRRNALQWLKRFDIENAEKRRIEELSKGNQQKVQIIISLIHEPEYVILDEPTSGLDPVNQELMKQIITELREQGRIIIYSTHQMELAERLCDRISLINKGKVVLSGSVEDVRQSHGGNNVLVEFEGDGAFLSELAPVVEADVQNNYAELQLQPEATLNDLLPHLASLRVGRIERIRPTLNAIFIDTVQARGESVDPAMLQRRDIEAARRRGNGASDAQSTIDADSEVKP
jgi:ABC-2 type transport system ATP-binding protein